MRPPSYEVYGKSYGKREKKKQEKEIRMNRHKKKRAPRISLSLPPETTVLAQSTTC